MLSKSKSFFIKTYGCLMNYSDSERIRRVLLDSGLNEVFVSKNADIIVLVSCSIRQQAEDKISGWGIKAGKEAYKDKTFVLTGCMAYRDAKRGKFEKYLTAVKKTYPWVDLIVDIRDLAKLPELLGVTYNSECSESEQKEDYFEISPLPGNKYTYYLPISTGCNNFCTYCIVPYARGELKDRSLESIISEAERAIKFGVKHLVILGQNVNSWKGISNGQKYQFADLLTEVSKIDGEFWISFLSSNPMDFSDELSDVIATNQKIVKWLNLAVQSGSDQILKRMNRRYTVGDFKSIISKLRLKSPDFRITTDIIVGFPGETEEDFNQTIDLVKESQFDMVYLGKYSPRKGTVAANFDDNVSMAEKRCREKVVKDLIDDNRTDKHKSLVGKILPALSTGGRRGITYFNHEVIFSEALAEEQIGKFLTVKIIDSSRAGLVCVVAE